MERNETMLVGHEYHVMEDSPEKLSKLSQMEKHKTEQIQSQPQSIEEV
jgi:hypothetical protein